MIPMPLHQVVGFASIFPNVADRSVGIDALGVSPWDGADLVWLAQTLRRRVRDS
jgi:hypothetical protein